MKAKNLALMALVAGSLLFGSANTALAEDKPLPVVDCAEGYEAVSSDDGYTVTCEPVTIDPTSQEVTPNEGCWTTEDGTDVCARGFVGSTDPEPVVPKCETSIADDGTETTVCAYADEIAYSGLPVDEISANSDEIKYKSDMQRDLVLTAAGSTQDGTLPFLGMFFGLLGAAVLALMHKPITK
ncbi:MAG: hypothetical protein EBR26_00055 [Microbacteriaceae bacterium]|nr:hypothetical protein [Microbacteriaceae bacterium]